MKHVKKPVFALAAALALAALLCVSALGDDDHIVQSGGTSRNGAVSIQMDHTYASEMSNAWQEQWYRFTTPGEPGYTTFHVSNNSIDDWVYFYLLTGIEQQKVSLEVSYSRSESRNLRLDPNTTYYVLVRNREGQNGFYSFRTGFTGDSVGNSYDSAASIDLNTEYTSTIDGNSDTDFLATGFLGGILRGASISSSGSNASM